MPILKKKTKSKKRVRKAPVRSANYADIHRALTKHGAEILEQIPLNKVQLSQPVDGGPPRISVSVEKNQIQSVPQTVAVKLGRNTVSITIEARDDYSAVQAQSKPK